MKIGPIYLELHLTRKARKQNMRDNILRNAERLHQGGLDSRIPFLKWAFSGKKDLAGSTAREDMPVPEWTQGQIISNTTILEVHRFNIFNAKNGLQALPMKKENGRITAVKVIRCKTRWKGDLRLTFVSGASGVNVPYGAVFNRFFNQIMVDTDRPIFEYFLAHEFEHARHINLVLMSLPFDFLQVLGSDPVPPRKTEYLAMLNETVCTKDIPLVDIALSRKRSCLVNKDQHPHLIASTYFVARLMFRYGMAPGRILDAHDAWKAAIRTKELDNPTGVSNFK